MRQRVELDQRLDPLQVGQRGVMRGFGARAGRLGCIELHHEGLGVHLEQNLSGLDHRAFGVRLLVEETGHPRHDVHLLRALREGHIFGRHRRVAGLDLDHAHLRRRRWRRCCRFVTAGDKKNRRARGHAQGDLQWKRETAVATDHANLGGMEGVTHRRFESPEPAEMLTEGLGADFSLSSMRRSPAQPRQAARSYIQPGVPQPQVSRKRVMNSWLSTDLRAVPFIRPFVTERCAKR